MNFASYRCLFVLMYCSSAVLVVVSGQPTTDDDVDRDDEISKLIDTVAQLRAEFRREQAKSAERIAKLETELAASVTNTRDADQSGANYVRWGRKTCENNATLVYKGYATGPRYNQVGSGSNFLCLPEEPQWKTYLDGDQYSGSIAGVEYQLWNSGTYTNNVFSLANNGGNSLLDNPAPCAVCYVAGRSTVLMVPARTQCPDGWTTEYAGYLASDASFDRQRSSYICWDEAPEVAIGGTAQNQALIYPVEVRCGSLPCSVYITGRELTCIVCSK